MSLARRRRRCLNGLRRSSREKCKDSDLRRVLREYVEYYNHARPHQGINQQIPAADKRSGGNGRIRRRDVLGGIIHDYYRQAA